MISAFRYRIDSDEPQHLHVVWGWTRGLLQYRDVFDNHMPLFHLLCAPLLRMFGEHSASLLAMRLMMLPLYAAALILTYRIASTCYSGRDAVTAVVIAAFIPSFFLTSAEFRPDVLWAVCWLAAMLVVVEGNATPARAATAGLLIGFAFAVSMKTSLLVFGFIAGAAVVAIASRRFSLRVALRLSVPLLLGAMIVPAVVTLFFAANGALRDFYYGTMGHNLIWRWKPKRLLTYPLLLTLITIVAREMLRSRDDRRAVLRRVFLFVSSSVYAATLFCIWPLVEREHWLPYAPLAAIAFAPFVSRPVRRYAFAAVQVVIIVFLGALWRDNTTSALRLIDETLRLTTPEDAVVDLKGETVFRHRAFHHVLEPITKAKIQSGVLRDSLPEDVIRHHALVAVGDDGAFPRHARRFLKENFVRAGLVRVAGCALPPWGGRFTIRIAAPYAIRGALRAGTLDGTPYRGPRFLAPGMHTFVPSRPARRVLFVVWARAVERGFDPAVIAGN